MTGSGSIAKSENDSFSFHPALRIAAKIISYIFHPLFIPLYVILFLLYEARLFNNVDPTRRIYVVIQFFVSYTLLPLATILLMKALGFIKSVFLKSQKDRILPYVVCEIYYFWAWYVSKNLLYPREVVMFSLAVFLASCMGLILNIYLKVSMHALSLGVVITFALVLGLRSEMNYGPYISIAFLIAGIVATARMLNSDHSEKEVYAGLLAGAIAQVIACFFV